MKATVPRNTVEGTVYNMYPVSITFHGAVSFTHRESFNFFIRWFSLTFILWKQRYYSNLLKWTRIWFCAGLTDIQSSWTQNFPNSSSPIQWVTFSFIEILSVHPQHLYSPSSLLVPSHGLSAVKIPFLDSGLYCVQLWGPLNLLHPG
jgi:hypothetical protein